MSEHTYTPGLADAIFFLNVFGKDFKSFRFEGQGKIRMWSIFTSTTSTFTSTSFTSIFTSTSFLTILLLVALAALSYHYIVKASIPS